MPQSLIDMGLPPMPPLEEQEKRIYGMDERSFKDMMTRIETLYNSRLLRRNQIRKTLFNQEDFDREKFYEEEFKFHWNLTVEYHFGPAYRQIDQNFPSSSNQELKKKWRKYFEYCPTNTYDMERAREYYVEEQQKLLEQQMAKEADLIQKMRDEDQKERHTPEHHTSRSTSTPCEEEVISESDVIVSETKPLIPSTKTGLRKRR